MNLTVATEAHFRQTPEGRIRTDTGTNGYRFWCRYLDTFDAVTVLARVSLGPDYDGTAVEGDRVSVRPLSGYTGLTRLPFAVPALRRDVAAAVAAPGHAFLARVPGIIGGLLIAELRRRVRPYAVEVVGDPREVLASGLAPALGAGLGRLAAGQLRRQCAGAVAAGYVTERALQEHYPPGRDAVSTWYSSVELGPESFVDQSRRPGHAALTRLVTVGTQSQFYKGHDVLLEAVAQLRSEGRRVTLRIVGDGRFGPRLRAAALAAGLAEVVTFVGQLPAGRAVQAELDAADLFVLPSRTEGLPRALIEAMARGLPCVATRVGGVPELLPDAELVPAGDARALARRIGLVLDRPELLTGVSARNLEVAHRYAADRLAARARLLREALRDRSRDAARTPA